MTLSRKVVKGLSRWSGTKLGLSRVDAGGYELVNAFVQVFNVLHGLLRSVESEAFPEKQSNLISYRVKCITASRNHLFVFFIRLRQLVAEAVQTVRRMNNTTHITPERPLNATLRASVTHRRVRAVYLVEHRSRIRQFGPIHEARFVSFHADSLPPVAQNSTDECWPHQSAPAFAPVAY